MEALILTKPRKDGGAFVLDDVDSSELEHARMRHLLPVSHLFTTLSLLTLKQSVVDAVSRG